jgi:DNA-binding PadR family transcriptional regulator
MNARNHSLNPDSDFPVHPRARRFGPPHGEHGFRGREFHDADREGGGRGFDPRGRPGGGRGRGRGRFGPGGPGGRDGGPGLPGFLPRGARVARGDIRAGILVLLLEGPMHGYQLIHELHERSGGVWRPSPGSVYPTLKRLSAEGLVAAADGGGHRREFTLTDDGRAEADRLAAISTPWEELLADEDQAAIELRDLVESVVDAARQVVRVAEPQQVADAKRVLVDARRRLYGILAAEPQAGASDDTPDGDGEASASA